MVETLNLIRIRADRNAILDSKYFQLHIFLKLIKSKTFKEYAKLVFEKYSNLPSTRNPYNTQEKSQVQKIPRFPQTWTRLYSLKQSYFVSAMLTPKDTFFLIQR